MTSIDLSTKNLTNVSGSEMNMYNFDDLTSESKVVEESVLMGKIKKAKQDLSSAMGGRSSQQDNSIGPVQFMSNLAQINPTSGENSTAKSSNIGDIIGKVTDGMGKFSEITSSNSTITTATTSLADTMGKFSDVDPSNIGTMIGSISSVIMSMVTKGTGKSIDRPQPVTSEFPDISRVVDKGLDKEYSKK